MKWILILPVIFTTASDVVERNVKRMEGSKDSLMPIFATQVICHNAHGANIEVKIKKSNNFNKLE